MAVEAQLCPQCGAGIHFSELQTELICPFCGTTVVKPTLKPSARDEAWAQEQDESEHVVKAMVVLQKKLSAQGVPQDPTQMIIHHRQ